MTAHAGASPEVRPTDTNRFPALTPEQMSEQQRQVAAEIAAGPRGALRGPFIALIHNPALAGHLQHLGEHLRFQSTLSPALIELAVLVTARHWTCQYEWFAHERIARQTTDLPDAVIRAIAAGATPPRMSTDASAVHAFCIGTLRAGQPDDAVYDTAVQRFGREGVLEIIALCGYYSLLAMVLNTARIPLPEGTQPPLQTLGPPSTAA
jgi:4-carboxymuconolactone decarboxylase